MADIIDAYFKVSVSAVDFLKIDCVIALDDGETITSVTATNPDSDPALLVDSGQANAARWFNHKRPGWVEIGQSAECRVRSSTTTGTYKANLAVTTSASRQWTMQALVEVV